MSPWTKPFSPLLISSSVLVLSALMAATVFSIMALASAAVPCANAAVENKTAMAPSAPITSLRNMDIPPCLFEQFAIVMHRTQARKDHIQTLPQSPVSARARDELINGGGVAISGFGTN